MDESYSSIDETNAHIGMVDRYLSMFEHQLRTRARQHDYTKKHNPELDIFDVYTPKLKGTTYGSEEYRGYLAEMKVALDHHYANNRHHPEWIRYNLEEWRSVVGFEGYYEVSNLGEVKGLARRLVRNNGRPLSITEKIRKQHLTPRGYKRVQLKDRDGSSHSKLVHVLVAEAFIGPQERNLQVNHKDGDKGNNRASNIGWVTPSEKLQHAHDTGLRKAKYVVHCNELDVTTYGSTKMEVALKKLGYKKARSSTILACINGNCSHHMNLTFTSDQIEEWSYSPLNDMSLIDLVEMFCDWFAATKRHADGDIIRSIEINGKRFGISEQLKSILRNTVETLDPHERLDKD